MAANVSWQEPQPSRRNPVPESIAGCDPQGDYASAPMPCALPLAGISVLIRTSLVALLSAACATTPPGVPQKSRPLVRLIARGPSAHVERLDWGGRGPAPVFSPGPGNTAHLYQ